MYFFKIPYFYTLFINPQLRDKLDNWRQEKALTEIAVFNESLLKQHLGFYARQAQWIAYTLSPSPSTLEAVLPIPTSNELYKFLFYTKHANRIVNIQVIGYNGRYVQVTVKHKLILTSQVTLEPTKRGRYSRITVFINQT